MELEKMERPTLGVLKPGDPVIAQIINRGVSEHQATVTDVGRVWINVRPEGWGRTLRFRMDTQNMGSGYSSSNRFVTPEQHAYDKRMATADTILNDAGIEIRRHASLSRNDAFRVWLATRVAELMEWPVP